MSNFPSGDAKDQIIRQTARILRYWQRTKPGDMTANNALFSTAAALSSYGDTLGAEEILKILTTIPIGRSQ